MQKHLLKVWPLYFKAITHPDPKQRKTVELRYDDRGYQVGDELVLQEWDPDVQTYTGNQATRFVTHITKGQPWLSQGYEALSVCENN